MPVTSPINYSSRYGWSKDPYKPTDFLLAAAKPSVVLPKKMNNSAFIPCPWDQSNQGSCTGQGIGAVVTGMAMKLGLYSAARTDPTVRFSPRWLYYLGRLAIGTVDEDSGANPRDIMDAIIQVGCAEEAAWPYPPPPADFNGTANKPHVPPATVADNAKLHIVTSFTRVVDGERGIKTALANGLLVALGAPWYSSWENPGANGQLAKVNCRSIIAGGHETYLYGYDDSLNDFLGSNSWGNQWGNHGRYLMPYGALNAFKAKGGYDAHTVTVTWSK